MRDHIWFDCDLWIKKHKLPDDEVKQRRWGDPAICDTLNFIPFTLLGVSSLKHLMQEWYEAPINLEAVIEFLRLNPAVETFAWLKLVD